MTLPSLLRVNINIMWTKIKGNIGTPWYTQFIIWRKFFNYLYWWNNENINQNVPHWWTQISKSLRKLFTYTKEYLKLIENLIGTITRLFIITTKPYKTASKALKQDEEKAHYILQVSIRVFSNLIWLDLQQQVELLQDNQCRWYWKPWGGEGCWNRQNKVVKILLVRKLLQTIFYLKCFC